MMIWILIATGLSAFSTADSEFDFDLGFHDGLAVVKQIDELGENKPLENEMPENIDLSIDFLHDDFPPYILHLEHITEDSNSKPIYTLRRLGDGSSTIVKEDIAIEQNVGLYQDDESNSAFTVTCDGLEFGLCNPKILGSLNLNGTDFDIKPCDDRLQNTIDSGTLYTIHRRHNSVSPTAGYTRRGSFAPTAVTPSEIETANSEFNLYAMRNRYRYVQNSETSSYNSYHSHGSGYGGRSSGAAEPYSVGLLVVVDDIIFHRFYAKSKGYTKYERIENAKAQIRQYYAHTINAIDIRYKNIRHAAYEIRIVVTGYLIDDHHMMNIWSDPREAAVEDAIYSAIAWRKSMISELPPHDHIMIFTGRDLYTRSTRDYSVTGFASLDSMCRYDSVSIIEDRGGFDCIVTATHELGHSLGARHDGDRNACSPLDKFIMTSIGGDVTHNTRLNPFKFSSCSKNYFLDKIQSLGSVRGNCLSVRKEYYDPREFSALNSVATGQLFDANKQCQMKLGENSYYGWGGNLGSFRDICTHMACKSNKTATSYNLYNAARGTSCGNQMWCIDGECQYDPKAPATDDTCVHGDSLRSFAAFHSCAHMIASDPSRCTDPYYRQFCCVSCKQYGLNSFIITDSPYQPSHRESILSIPTTNHIYRTHHNTFSDGGMFGDMPGERAPVQYPSKPVSSGNRNNINRHLFDSSNSHATTINKFRVFSLNNGGESKYGTNSYRRPHQQYDDNPFLAEQNHESYSSSAVTSYGGGTNHQINNLPAKSSALNSNDLTAFRNLIMRTLQLLQRSNAHLLNASPSQASRFHNYDDPRPSFVSNRNFFSMQNLPRTVINTEKHGSHESTLIGNANPKNVSISSGVNNIETNQMNIFKFLNKNKQNRTKHESTSKHQLDMNNELNILGFDNYQNNMANSETRGESVQSFRSELDVFGFQIGQNDNNIPINNVTAMENNFPVVQKNIENSPWNRSIENVIDPFLK